MRGKPGDLTSRNIGHSKYLKLYIENLQILLKPPISKSIIKKKTVPKNVNQRIILKPTAVDGRGGCADNTAARYDYKLLSILGTIGKH